MIKNILTTLLLLAGLGAAAQTVSRERMQQIYDEVKTPYKYGMVVAPADNYHKIDCPTVFRENGKWYMTYVVYNGKDGLDGRGYETWLAESDDLLSWNTLGRILSYHDNYWDSNQRGGFPALIDWTWGGQYDMKTYKGKHWMTYIGGNGTGYEAVREPLHIGLAWTGGDISKAHEWCSADTPALSINDKDAQWWEKLTQYKSTIYEDAGKALGSRFIMFYNAGGINPANGMKAERIGIALSDNMKKWKRYKGNPVFFNEVKGIITGDAQIVRMGDVFVMFYFSAFDPSRKYNAFNTFAVSRDLINWQRWDGQDLIFPTKKYDEMFAHKSCVVKHDGVVYHFYCAVNNDNQRGIAVATSAPMGRSAVSFPAPEAKKRRTLTRLDKEWTTRLLTASDSLAPIGRDTVVSLPHNWDDYYGCRQLLHGNLHGSAMYTKTFVQKKQAGRRYFLQLEGVGTYATVTLNGKEHKRELVGRTVYTEDITDDLKDGTNTLQIKADHPAMITSAPWVCGGCSSEWGFSEGSQPFGIFRPVTVVETDEVRIEPFGVHIWNNDRADSLFIDTEIRNYSSEAAEIELVSKFAQASGKQVFRLTEKLTLQPGETRTVRQASPVANPTLWSTESPYLYSLASMIKRGGKTTDEITNAFGIRTVSWPVKRQDGDNRLLINGKPQFINGVCEYEHQFGQSHAFSSEQIQSRIKQIRNAGFNAFREAHQPHNLEYQALLDREGIMFWSQFSAHIWYDTPEFKDNFKRMLRRWIKERRNSPSIIMWGLQNESTVPAGFAAECCDIIREMDPTARNMRVITTCNGGGGTDWNVIQNWSGTYGGTAKEYDKELCLPNQLLNGEYGAWRTLGLHSEAADLSKEKAYSEEKFTELLETKMRLAEKVRDSVCGHFQWVFSSHDNPGRIQPDEALRTIDKAGPFNYKGIVTPWEQPVDGYYMYRAYNVPAEKDPMVYIVSHTWPDRFKDGPRRADINVYSNCDSVLLYNDATDGMPLGRKKAGPHFVWEKRMIRYNVLRAVGYHGGKPVAEDVIILNGLERAPHFDALYNGSAIVPTAAQRSRDLLKGNGGYSYMYRVNCGGDCYTDSYGQKWHADNAAVSHSWGERFGLNPYQTSQGTVSTPIYGTHDWELFQSFRFGRHNLRYDFPVSDGEYIIELYFTEPWHGMGGGLKTDCEGLRIFDVAVNGRTVLDDIDIWAESGKQGALRKTVRANAENGRLSISFPEVKAGQAVISAIAIAREGTQSSGDMKEQEHAGAQKPACGMDKCQLSSFMWKALDADVMEKMPKDMLPKGQKQREATSYAPVKTGKNATEWNITPGLGQEYALRFHYKNETQEPVTAEMKIIDNKGITLVQREITFPPTPKKFKILNTSTGTQINAGHYRVIITAGGAQKLEFKDLDVQ